MSPKTKYIRDQLSYYQINIRNLIRNRTTCGHAINNSINTNHGVAYSEITNLLSENLIEHMERQLEEKIR
jgi:hypothetical protein